MSIQAVDRHRVTGPPGLLDALEGQAALGFVGPNWFASVMGTGIVAVAAASLPFDVPGLPAFATLVWVLDVLLLAGVLAATAGHWARHPEVARGHLTSQVMSHFYGAPAMALMTVGAGGLLVGHRVVGTPAAVGLDAVLWTAGTLLGLWTTVAVPLRALRAHDVGLDAAFGGWLMPVVPPMVSAATGALLLPHVAVGAPRVVLLVCCYAMFTVGLAGSAVVIALVARRLLRHGVGAAAAVPTLWIVLGPLGQSVTAAYNLGRVAPDALPASYATGLRMFALLYGVPVWCLAMGWLAVALTITVRTARRHLPFSLTWWSFTFPVGTLVTGTSALATQTGAGLWTVSAGVLYALLLAAWSVVAVRTARGTWTGVLLRAPAA